MLCALSLAMPISVAGIGLWNAPGKDSGRKHSKGLLDMGGAATVDTAEKALARQSSFDVVDRFDSGSLR
jgi:hypothetical protein